jgi:acetyl-CoA carboxylase biotin carboxyl carrier protein
VASRRPRQTSADPAGLAERLAELAARHGLAELEVQHGDLRVRVVRERAAAPLPPPRAAAPPADGRDAAAAEATDRLVTIEAPMVGTFYRAARPDAPPYVSEGDHVKEGQVLCIIEAMKLMNEIEARAAGRIARILVDNAQPVEYGQPLFLVDPGR